MSYSFVYETKAQHHPRNAGVMFNGPHWNVFDDKGTFITWGSTKLKAAQDAGKHEALVWLFNKGKAKQAAQDMANTHFHSLKLG